MPTVTNSTGRKMLSDLMRGAEDFVDSIQSDICIASTTVTLSGSTEPIGTLLKFNSATDKFVALEMPPDWAADTVTAIGDIVKPTTQNGYHYMCTARATDFKTHAATEPTWTTVLGTTITDDAVTWTVVEPFADIQLDSILPNKTNICITVGDSTGLGHNPEDVAAASSVKMTVLYRGTAVIKTDGVEWGSLTTADKAEIKGAFERRGIIFSDSATSVTPTYLG